MTIGANKEERGDRTGRKRPRRFSGVAVVVGGGVVGVVDGVVGVKSKK